jgi:hypothetical protein
MNSYNSISAQRRERLTLGKGTFFREIEAQVGF